VASKRQATSSNANPTVQAATVQQPSSLVLVSTDVCIKVLAREGGQQLGTTLLIQYELPAKREHLQRRMAAAFGTAATHAALDSAASHGTRHIVISFVLAGEIPAFRTLEKMAYPTPILEVPVHVGDMFAANARR
jgi:hypothetical protein